MALQITAFVKKWLGSGHVGTSIDTNAAITLQQRNGDFCAARVAM
jgi:hypothetical protein